MLSFSKLKHPALDQTGISIVLLILSFLGFIDAAYLTITHYQNVIPACTVLGGCELVVTSQFSTVLGIPLALLGTIYFFILFYLSIAILSSRKKLYAKLFNRFAYLGLLVSLFLFLIQALILKAFCQYCLLSEAIALSIYIFSIQLLRKHTD
ncbi:vitamin K epoxide reductase family protein [Patescibacteria group bacterium]|nr:vitamin K epoxide reductase family protein [Patescibacteria group bacterium]